jgi:hypothetical protein
MSTYGTTMLSRNDGYGNYQVERTVYALNSALRSYDEVIYVDWASEGKTLVEEFKDLLIDTRKFKYVIVTPKQAQDWTKNFVDAERCTEVLGRNIGLRRLSTDFLVSTNPDVIQPVRSELEKFTDVDLFAAGGKRTISLLEIRKLGGIADDLTEGLLGLQPEYGQQPVVSVIEGDVWSLVSGCGDFQIAHRDIWYAIRGFEESLMGRGFADTNVQKKAALAGYRIDVDWTMPVWHIGHEGGGGGVGAWNTPEFAVRDFMQTTNSEHWGFSNDRSLKLKRL